MITDLQKRTAQAIVNIFETSMIRGNYGSVVLTKGDRGHLTYGRSQTTLASGNLALLLHAYCQANGQFSTSLAPYLPACDRQDLSLDHNEDLKDLLRLAGQDLVMQTVQDDFFDRVYWKPATNRALNLQIKSALGTAVLYDSTIHGSFVDVRNMVIAAIGPCNANIEKDWIRAYVNTRRDWLANNTDTGLHPTVYRMDTFQNLITSNKWDLELPLKVRGLTITETSLKPQATPPLPPVIVSAAGPEDRILMLTAPMMQGPEVKRLQQALGLPVAQQDGVFGSITDAAVRTFQSSNGLVVDGRVGKATSAALETAPSGTRTRRTQRQPA